MRLPLENRRCFLKYVDVVQEPGEQMGYCYDLGDHFRHEITVISSRLQRSLPGAHLLSFAAPLKVICCFHLHETAASAIIIPRQFDWHCCAKIAAHSAPQNVAVITLAAWLARCSHFLRPLKCRIRWRLSTCPGTSIPLKASAKLDSKSRSAWPMD